MWHLSTKMFETFLIENVSGNRGGVVKRVIITFLCGVLSIVPPLEAQSVYCGYVATTGNVSLSSSTYAATLQQPSTGSVPVSFSAPAGTLSGSVGATIWCSVACTATLSRNCTSPATVTAGSVVSILTTTPPAFVRFFAGSDAASCTTLRVLNVGAGIEYPVDLSTFQLSTGGTTSNLTLSVASMTGSVNITFYPVEYH